MVAVSVHPGAVATDFVDHFIPRWLRDLATPILNLIQITPEQSSTAIVHACLSDNAQALNGKYLSLTKLELPSPIALSEPLAEQLWEQSVQQISSFNFNRTKNKN
jgi:hypothetical protein